ncbi:hypothetical protein NEAUS03_0985 [Nematocida ausubeli]|nr:hypothetical protein NEAUS03_0985 [Nematocida ausubeli]
MSIEEEVRDAMKKRNYKKAESLFSKHISESFSVEMHAEYLAFINATNKDMMKDALAFSYNHTLYNTDSLDIKIQYLESIMEENDPERVKEVYTSILEIPIKKVDTIIELYKNFENTKSKIKKKDSDLLSKEIVAVEESKAIQKLNDMQAIEYFLLQYKNNYPIYTIEYILYNVDCALSNGKIKNRSRNKMLFYKILILSKKVDKKNIIDKNSKEIILAKGVSEKNQKISGMLWNEIRNTNDILPLLPLLIGYAFDIDQLLAIAPPGITKKSESFYLILFGAILKHRGIEGMRKYLIKLTKERKIGWISYNYCARVEGLIGGGNKYAGGILLTALKIFIKGEDSRYYMSAEENAYKLALNGTQLLLSLGDAQRAHILIELYNKEKGKEQLAHATFKIREGEEEKDPKLMMVKHQMLYESGFAALLTISNTYSYGDLFDFLCRVYRIEDEDEVPMPPVLKKLIEELPKIRESQDIFSGVDINSIIDMLIDIEI